MTSLFEPGSYGGKFDGLSRLPKPWVPPFFPISHALFDRWREDGSRNDAKPQDLLDLVERARIETQVSYFGNRPEFISLIVRSDAREEGLEQRGLLKSARCDGTVEAILSASLEVFNSALQASLRTPLGLIVQAFCAPVLSGHFSNERHVSEEARQWTCEIDPSSQFGKETDPRVIRWRVEKAQPAPETELVASDRKALFEMLRSIGRYFYERKERRHLEWVWDGSRVWIVQNDRAPDPIGDSPEAQFMANPPAILPSALALFRPFLPADARKWQKIKCAETFAALNLPTTTLFVFNGKQKVRQLVRAGTLPELLADLRELTKAPLVIRTDLAGQTTLFANRTDCLSTPELAVSFMRDTARQLLAAGVAPEHLCFIAHRFIPAHASAFSMATPKGSRVTIDALWGLPDGLEFASHDSFEFDTRTSSIIGRRIRYKPTFLAALPDNSWKATPLGAPWDWKPSIDGDTVREIATHSKKLAEGLKQAVVIMWFARVPSGTGHPTLIPWRYVTEGEPRQVESVIGQHFLSKPYCVRNSEDLDRLPEQAQAVPSIVLKPDGPHLRDKVFLERLGSVAKAHGLRIDLEGSPLSHTYYVLKRTGAHVACVDPIKSRTVRRKFAKLVRDKIPIRIRRQGEKVVAVTLPEGELLDVLKTKIVEEAMEVLLATSSSSLQEEMADVLEVLSAMCKLGGGSLRKLQRLAAKKRRKAGGFGKGLMLVETEELPLLEVRSSDGLFRLGGIRATRDSYQSIVAAGRRLKTRRDRIIIPLVPSVPDRLRGPRKIYFRNPDLEFEIWYREKSVEVILVGNDSDSDAQLILPFPERGNRG